MATVPSAGRKIFPPTEAWRYCRGISDDPKAARLHENFNVGRQLRAFDFHNATRRVAGKSFGLGEDYRVRIVGHQVGCVVEGDSRRFNVRAANVPINQPLGRGGVGSDGGEHYRQRQHADKNFLEHKNFPPFIGTNYNRKIFAPEKISTRARTYRIFFISRSIDAIDVICETELLCFSGSQQTAFAHETFSIRFIFIAFMSGNCSVFIRVG